MGKYSFSGSSMERELAAKAGELDALRGVREQQLVNLTLKAIAAGVESKDADLTAAIAASKGQRQPLIAIVAREIVRVAEGRLWCAEYNEKARSNQQMMAFVGTHWEGVKPQLWKDFVDDCADRCGLAESYRKCHGFMNRLYENVAFCLKKFGYQSVPANQVWLNMRNGTLEVGQDGMVRLREHRKEDYFFYTLDYAYDPEAECSQWTKFLNRVLPEGDTQAVLAEFVGYCLMKDHRFEKMLWLYGGGQNGKSVTLDVIESLLGAGNVSYLSLSDLTTNDERRTGIEGKLLNISHESGKDVNPSVMKQLTSGEKVTMKHLYVDHYETQNYGKFIAAFNILPRAEISAGFFRRLIILPFNETIPDEEVDRNLTFKLRQELPAILNWVLSYLPMLMKRNAFTASPACEKALDSYKMQSDNVKLFASEMCEASSSSVPASDVYAAYRAFCSDSALKPLGRNKFYERMAALGFESEVYGHERRYKLKIRQL